MILRIMAWVMVQSLKHRNDSLLRETPLVPQGKALIRDRGLISFFRNNRMFKTKLKDLFKKGQ